MNQQHALIWRRPAKSPVYPGTTIRQGPPEWTTTIVSVGDWDDMQKRWNIADRRLRRLGLEGHLEVRSTDDPKTHVRGWSGVEPPTRYSIDAKAARLAILPGDRIRVRIYGNTYSGSVISTAIKSCAVRFAARTRKGGWGGEAPERERRFGIWDSTAIGSKMVEEVIK